MKTQYFQNYGTPLNEYDDYANFVRTNLIDKKYINPELGYLKLIFDVNDLLYKAEMYFDGELKTGTKDQERLKIKESIGKVKILDYIPNVPFNMRINKKGISYLGGQPENFEIPSYSEFSKFQFLGFINKNEPCFQELEFDICLTFPLFCSAGELFLDYTNVNAPKIFNKKEFWTEEVFTELDKDFEVEYFKTPISFEPVKGKIYETDEIGRSGFYLSDIASCYDKPLSPISKKPMNFLCQIEGGKEIPVKNTSVPKDYKLFNQGYEYLEFYSGDGELTVFYENETRLVLYIIGGS